MEHDKRLPDGRIVRAPEFTRRVLGGVPILFHLAEWLLFIVAFQYVDQKFGSMSAKIIWMLLATALSLYVGVLVSNVAWRYTADSLKHRSWDLAMRFILPALSGLIVFLLLKVVVKDMVAAEVG